MSPIRPGEARVKKINNTKLEQSMNKIKCMQSYVEGTQQLLQERYYEMIIDIERVMEWNGKMEERKVEVKWM